MLYFDKALTANHARQHGAWWSQEVTPMRLAFHQTEEAHAALSNQSAVLPRDAWLEMDTITKRIMRGDGGQTFMDDLMPLAKPINIGKMVAVNRVASDAGVVTVSLSGQVPTILDKTQYDYRGALIPIFSTAYYRNFREWNALQNENFDALADDQENSLWNLRRRNALYILNGDLTMSFEGYQGYGIRNSPYSKSINLGSAVGGANINLTTATADQIIAFFTGPFAAMLDANFIVDPVRIWVSPDIMRNLARPLSSAEGFKTGSIREFLERGNGGDSRIVSIKQTFELTGNEFFGFVPRAEFIRPLVGMATSTVAIPRLHPRSNYQFDVWNAMGIEIRADYNGRSGVFYSTQVN